jgi:Restriction Enzyme Adenine Methylase Associated
VEIADLINAGMVEVGQVLQPRIRNPKGLFATVLADGSLDVAGQIYRTPSTAAAAVTGKPERGWSYFLVDEGPPRRSLRKVRREYVDQLTVDVEDEDEAAEEDEDA